MAKALPEVKEDAKPGSIEEDWLSNFFDKCRLVSDDGMQYLWAKVLAGEANVPGTYSNRTVNFLQLLSQREAEKFQLVCSFAVEIEQNLVPLIYQRPGNIYDNAGLTHKDLEDLGNTPAKPD